MNNLLSLPDHQKELVVSRVFEGDFLTRAEYLVDTRKYDFRGVLEQTNGRHSFLDRAYHVAPTDRLARAFGPLIRLINGGNSGHLALVVERPENVPVSLDLGNGGTGELYFVAADGNDFLGNPAEVDFARGYVKGPEEHQEFFETLGFRYNKSDPPGTEYSPIYLRSQPVHDVSAE